MRRDLNKNWNIVPLSSIVTFHDRPNQMYRPTPLKQRHDLRLAKHSDTTRVRIFGTVAEKNETIFTYADGKSKENRPSLLVSVRPGPRTRISVTRTRCVSTMMLALTRRNCPRFFVSYRKRSRTRLLRQSDEEESDATRYRFYRVVVLRGLSSSGFSS